MKVKLYALLFVTLSASAFGAKEHTKCYLVAATQAELARAADKVCVHTYTVAGLPAGKAASMASTSASSPK